MGKKTGYHHGNLRAELLRAARTLVEEEGVEAVSLRAVARRAGVSPAAPYHHFADKGALIGALIADCFTELDEAARSAIAAIPSPEERLRALGMAYIRYALHSPALFRLMFRPEKSTHANALHAGPMPVFDVLLEVIDALHAQGKGRERMADALAAWSLVHGFAALTLDGPLRALALDPARAETLAEEVLESLTLVSAPD